MKATLEVNLPEEEDDFNTAVKGIDFIAALQDIATEFRQAEKYEEGVTFGTAKAIFYDILRDRGIVL